MDKEGKEHRTPHEPIKIRQPRRELKLIHRTTMKNREYSIETAGHEESVEIKTASMERFQRALLTFLLSSNATTRATVQRVRR